MAVVMLELQTFRGLFQYPGPGVVLSNDKRNANLICIACFDYGNQQLVTKSITGVLGKYRPTLEPRTS